ncbi:probable LRR receptor-like serine/threonine-protein kinase At1g53440 isoform X6 [Camellia sinensis]|uniref:probable LRR receptor-like serine/threonine-protein kinase At1g53440 isoform X6 n=1 Tax=Camellia sinensis TaxID=4442 RepID=UPI001035B6B7|nr:probable LRR receptor-like serine/threonine-protein kinase At1g53440 isoform X6 [Camellia sinensis]
MTEHLLLCRLLCSILLLSALTCKTIAFSTSNGTLPQEEADAINALLGYIERTSKYDGASSNFTASDCNKKSTLDVYCDCYNATCRVTQLDLSSTRLKGEIPKEIGKLTSLTDLYLNDNRFSKIPFWLQNLSRLSIILLDGNLLGGHIPTFFSQMKKLNILSLADNNFNGPIPPELGALPSLLELCLPNNNFSGNLRQSFDKLKNMAYFDVRGNNFNGQIPAFIAQWKDIEELYLMGNNFEWPVSHGVFQSLKNLTILQLADIAGSPRDFPIVNNQSLTHLTLRNCSLGGQIPEFIWQSQSLQYL